MNSRTQAKRLPRRSRAGFTLAEVLVGTALFTVVAMAITMTMMQAFKIIALARYEERAGNVLKIVADQFHTSVIDEKNPATPADPRKSFFKETADGATGIGMGWNKRLQTFVHESARDSVASADYVEGTLEGLKFALNTVGQDEKEAPIATLTRRVRFVNPADGTPYADGVKPAEPAAGYLVQADFVIRFTLLGQERILNATVLRNLNPTDK